MQGENESTSFTDHIYGGKTWEQLLAQPCSVVIAEAGTGKSEEFRQQALRLIANGKPAFYAALDLLAGVSLADALTIGSSEALAQWQTGTRHGYFFLDAVDEAKLANPRDFEKAIIEAAKVLAPGKGRYTLVISTRPHAWQANADRSMLAQRLGILPSPEKSEATVSDPDFSGDEREILEHMEGKSKTTTEPAVAIMRLAALSRAQVRKFAEENDVEAPDEFIEAIEHANAEVFATRPADLPGLIDLWKKDKKIGRYSDVVKHNIELKLSDTNPAYQGRGIAVDRAMLGAEALAAAATFSGRVAFLLPDKDIDESIRANAIDPAAVLRSWPAEEIRALLGTGLFDEALYGTVRFHHRTAREYLCAKWLWRLLDKRKNRRQIERTLIASPYGTEREVVRPSMKATAGWLALFDQDVRDKALHTDPKVLLEHGDASAQDVGTRGSMLRIFAERYKDRSHTPLRLDVREVRRLADPRLAETVRDLLRKHRGHHDVRLLLLRTVREGAIPGFCKLAFDLFGDPTMDSWTKTVAVEIVAATGTAAEKKRLASFIVRDARTLNRDVVGHAVETLWPTYIRRADLLAILTSVPANGSYSSDHLNLELDRFVTETDDQSLQLGVLSDLNALLSSPPLHERRVTRISQRYDWLLKPAGELACGIARQRPTGPYDPSLLSVLAMCQQADHLSRYNGDVHKTSTEIINASPRLKNALIWREIRADGQSGKVVEWWELTLLPALRHFNRADFDLLIEDIANCTLEHEQKSALSIAFAAYRYEEQPEDMLSALRAAANGNPALETQLDRLLNPPPPDPATAQSMSRLERMNRQHKLEAERRARNRQDWINRLKANPSHVGDLSIVDTLRLFDEIRRVNKRNTSWASDNWQSLIPDFGREVADNFHEFCRRYWREACPRVRSEGIQDENKTPYSVIIGLSGLAMDAGASLDWAPNLSPEEANAATRYATWELNGFPSWLTAVSQAQPEAVHSVLLKEVEWELKTPTTQQRNYVLSRLRHNRANVSPALVGSLVKLLERHQNAPEYAVTDIVALEVGEETPQQSFVTMVKEQARNAADPLRPMWIAAALSLDAGHGIAAYEAWVNAAGSVEARYQRATRVLPYLLGDDYNRGLSSPHKSFIQVRALQSMLDMLHREPPPAAVTPQDDEDADYAPLDSAERKRSHLIELLFNIPGRETYEALLALAAALPRRRDYFLSLAERRAEADAESPPWPASDVQSFAADAEIAPRTQAELFALALSRIDDLKHEYEHGDESEASLLRKVADEVELRKALANRLKQAARSNYTTGSEEELADGRRTDIRLHHAPVTGRVPIEIKIAGKWVVSKLLERLKNQLIGQYMQESNFGMFLLVNRGAPRDRKRWTLGGKLRSFDELVAWLNVEAKKLQRTRRAVQGLEVVGIDLLKRGERSPKIASREPKGKRAMLLPTKRSRRKR
jgi:hypothetical protein